jgi:hypothetical protein
MNVFVIKRSRVGFSLWRQYMNALPSLNDLIAQHRALETELAEAVAHPASTDSEIAAIKRRKLRIKDQIMEIEKHSAVAA